MALLNIVIAIVLFSFLLLKSIAKSEVRLIAFERKEAKKQKMKKRRKRAITLQGAIEKGKYCMLSHYLVNTIIF